MLRRLICLAAGITLLLASSRYCLGQEELVIDDFEDNISVGSEATIDLGAGSGSNVDARASTEIKYHGNQALQVNFDAVPGGYMWVARGYGLDVQGAGAWLVEPKDIDFKKFNAISFYMHGAGTKVKVAIDLIDSGSEYWRYLVDDNFSGWREFVIAFSDFFPRGDWQPQSADKNAEFNLPFRSFQFEPRPEGKGTIYFDYVRLVNIKKQ